MADVDSDERIAKRADNGVARRGRPPLNRTEGREERDNSESIRRAERRAMLNDVNTLLPPIPKIAGYHCFWATTTNSKDSVEQRQRLGYEFITRAELPDFLLNSQKFGELTEDRIMINEMVAMKIPEDMWEDDMLYKHHDLPNESINNLKDSVRLGQDGRGRQVAYTGGEFNNGIADGFASLRLDKPSLEGVR